MRSYNIIYLHYNYCIVWQTTVIPTSEELDTDVLGTMNSLQCFKDKERLVAELLNHQYVTFHFVSHVYFIRHIA